MVDRLLNIIAYYHVGQNDENSTITSFFVW